MSQMALLKKYFITIIITIGIIIVVLSIFVIIHAIFRFIFGWIGEILFVFFLYYLGTIILKLTVFPGSFKLFTRGLELDQSSRMARFCLKTSKIMRDIILTMHEEALSQSISELDYYKIQQFFVTYISVFEKMTINQEITPQQSELYRKILSLRENLTLYTFKDTNLYELVYKPQTLKLMIDKKRLPKIEDTLFNKLIAQLREFEDIFQKIVNNTGDGCWSCISNYFGNKQILGTTFMMKAIIQNTNNCKLMKIKSFDGVTLDGLFLNETDNEQSPIVIICQPNAAIFEFLYFQDNLIQSYRNMKINVFIWNYREYGENKGTISTRNLLKDSEFVFDYVLETIKPTEIIVHGYSLGGMVACHLGSVKKFSVLVVDRTFSSFKKLINNWYFHGVGQLFQMLTCWNYDSTHAFMKCQSFKIIASDPQDGIIDYPSSLIVDINRLQFLHQINILNQNDLVGQQSKLQLIRQKCQRKQGFKDAWHKFILSKNEMKDLYQSLSKIKELCRQQSITRQEFKCDVAKIQENLKKMELDEENQLETIIREDTLSNKQFNKQFTATDDKVFIRSCLELVQEYFEYFEGGYLTFNDLFEKIPINLRFRSLYDLILSIFIRGSYMPITNIIQDKITPQKSLQVAQDKMALGLTKLSHLIEQQNGNLEFNIVMRDLCVVVKKLEAIRMRFKKVMKSSGKDIELTEPIYVSEESAVRSMQFHTLGYLLPLQCGHNGRFREDEQQYLKFYLIEAGVIKND